MSDRQKTGGIASLIEAATFLVGLALFGTALADYTTGDPDAAESVAFLADNQAVMYVWNLIIFIVFGVVLVVLALALYERLRVGARAIAQTATAFGMIWAGLVIAAGMVANIGWAKVIDLHDTDPEQAESLWLAVDSVYNGLGGGNEIVGGVWVLLISWAALRSGLLPRALNYLGLVIGIAGLVTMVPALELVGAVFGLGLIVWFVWLGAVMLSDRSADRDPIDITEASTSTTVTPTDIPC
jgi:hypothetical protein